MSEKQNLDREWCSPELRDIFHAEAKGYRGPSLSRMSRAADARARAHKLRGRVWNWVIARARALLAQVNL